MHNAELIAHVQSELMSSLFVIQCSVSYVLACSIALLLHKLVLALTAIHKSTVNMFVMAMHSKTNAREQQKSRRLHACWLSLRASHCSEVYYVACHDVLLLSYLCAVVLLLQSFSFSACQ